MQWSDVISDPSLRNLPYKIELNKWGNIEMSPASNRHNYLESEILVFLRNALPTGKAFVECSIDTPEGVKVADVIWCSPEFWQRHGLATPYPAAPEICVEVISPSNSIPAMTEKIKLYLAQGALEVWLVDEHGRVEVYTRDRKRERSDFVNQFPRISH